MTCQLPERRIAYGALDGNGAAYLVTEEVADDPEPSREAIRLADFQTLEHADQIAAGYNRDGRMIFSGGLPLTGDRIPELHAGREG